MVLKPLLSFGEAELREYYYFYHTPSSIHSCLAEEEIIGCICIVFMLLCECDLCHSIRILFLTNQVVQFC